METLLRESASCKSFHFMKDTHTKIKTLNALGQKHQVVHDHYSFWNLKTTGSSTEVQFFKTCLRGNEGSPAFFTSWSSISTMSMLKLPNVSTTSTITFSLIFKSISSLTLLSFCLTGAHSSLNGNRCTTISVSRPGMSWYDHAYTSL